MVVEEEEKEEEVCVKQCDAMAAAILLKKNPSHVIILRQTGWREIQNSSGEFGDAALLPFEHSQFTALMYITQFGVSSDLAVRSVVPRSKPLTHSSR